MVCLGAFCMPGMPDAGTTGTLMQAPNTTPLRLVAALLLTAQCPSGLQLQVCRQGVVSGHVELCRKPRPCGSG